MSEPDRDEVLPASGPPGRVFVMSAEEGASAERLRRASAEAYTQPPMHPEWARQVLASLDQAKAAVEHASGGAPRRNLPERPTASMLDVLERRYFAERERIAAAVHGALGDWDSNLASTIEVILAGVEELARRAERPWWRRLFGLR